MSQTSESAIDRALQAIIDLEQQALGDHCLPSQLKPILAALLTRRDQPEPTRGRYDMNEPKREGAELLAFLDIAHDELSALCKGKRFRMSVPVQKDDSDMILGDALRDAKAYIVKLEASATRRDAPQERHGEDSATRVAPLKAGDDGQDLHRK